MIRVRLRRWMLLAACSALGSGLAHETNFGLSPGTVYRGGWLTEYSFHQEEASKGPARSRSRGSDLHVLYGVRADVTLGMDLSWRTLEESRGGPSERASGPGDLGLLAKYRLFKIDDLLTTDYVSLLGEYRLRTAPATEHPDLSEEGGSLLVGVGTARIRKFWAFWADAGARVHEKRGGDRNGRETLANLGLGWRPRVAEIDEMDFQGILELNHEQQAGDRGHAAWFLSPGVTFGRGTTLLKAAVQLPVRQHWDAGQAEVEYRLKVTVEHLF